MIRSVLLWLALAWAWIYVLGLFAFNLTSNCGVC